MARKIKQKRGYYRKLRNELKSTNMTKIKMFKSVEFWLKHISDPTKDVRFYVEWTSHTEIADAWKLIGKMDKDQYEEHVMMQSHDTPKTRKEKAIYRSLLHGIPHLSEVC